MLSDSVGMACCSRGMCAADSGCAAWYAPSCCTLWWSLSMPAGMPATLGHIAVSHHHHLVRRLLLLAANSMTGSCYLAVSRQRLFVVIHKVRK